MPAGGREPWAWRVRLRRRGNVSWLDGVVLGVVAVAAILDLRTHRIPNWLTLPALLLGFILRFALLGPPGVLSGLLGLLVGAGLFLLPYMLGGMGAGDVKLMAVVGAFLGPAGALWAVLFTGVAGGVLAVTWALLRGRFGRTLARAGALLAAAADPRRRAAQGGLPNLERDAGWAMPYAVAIAFGVALSMWWRGS
jgi:prepilin peptidase CpaA